MTKLDHRPALTITKRIDIYSLKNKDYLFYDDFPVFIKSLISKDLWK